MRNAFVRTLIKIARENPNVYLITGDLGFMVMEPFRDEFAHRFINAGVQEANMIGMASGLAMSGKIVYAYSIVPFIAYRALEQVRNDVCYHKLNVRIVGVGGGYSYGIMGPTHHALEDIGVMKSLPNMTVVCPGDPSEVEETVKTSVSFKGPLYIRLGKAGEPILHSEPYTFEIGRASILKEGKDLALIATGNMLETAVLVSKKLEHLSLNARVVSMHTVSPVDEEMILKCAKETTHIFTLEEHMYDNGLAASVSMVLAKSDNKKFIFHPFGVKKGFADVVGKQDYLKTLQGLDVDSISATILKIIKNHGSRR